MPTPVVQVTSSFCLQSGPAQPAPFDDHSLIDFRSLDIHCTLQQDTTSYTSFVVADRLPWTFISGSTLTIRLHRPSSSWMPSNPESEHRWESFAESSRPAGRSLACA
jgi:hypothetical protein